MLVRVKKQGLAPRRLMRSLVLMLAVFYLAYHTLHGERGLYALMRDQHEVKVLKKELEATRAERERVEHRVSSLRDGSLDRDLLDEQMRRMMGVMKQGEIVILQGNG